MINYIKKLFEKIQIENEKKIYIENEKKNRIENKRREFFEFEKSFGRPLLSHFALMSQRGGFEKLPFVEKINKFFNLINPRLQVLRNKWLIKFYVFKERLKIIKKDKKNFLSFLFAWFLHKKSFNVYIKRQLLKPYNVWIFFINYSLNYYLFAKLYFAFLTYLFYIISQKFMKLTMIFKLKGYEILFDLMKQKDHSRYHLGVRPHTFFTTFSRRIKKGLL